MFCRHPILAAILAVIFIGAAARADDKDDSPQVDKVYGEWRIQTRPDRGAEYNRLIEQQGLPLFREAGGRMVGWWTTLVGNLYEQVTIWEYDDMASFERAIGLLGNNDGFAKFVAARDPLLVGEQNRFLKLAAGAEKPRLPETAKYVVHERHRVALDKQADYLKFFAGPGLTMLKQQGFHVVGPWTVRVGRWTEATWLFGFESLAEREKRIAHFSKHADSAKYSDKLGQLVDEVTTQILMPAPFAQPAAAETPAEAVSLLPHLQRIAPNVYAAGFADRYRSANCGWLRACDEAWLIDLPRGVPLEQFLDVVSQTAGQPARRLILTQWQPNDEAIVHALTKLGIERIVTSPAIGERLAASGKIAAALIEQAAARMPIGDSSLGVAIMPLDGIVGAEGACVYASHEGVLFAGPLVAHGPRVQLSGCDTEQWLAILEELSDRNLSRVVPGRGTWGGNEQIERQRRFLSELRQRVAYVVAQGRPLSMLSPTTAVAASDLVWMPYDTPTNDDLAHVYRELTVPFAPFKGHSPEPNDARPDALVLIGDQPHEPQHIETGLRPAFEATGVVPHFAVDVRALTAENLSRVRLLVILRDGLQRPSLDHAQDYVWMAPEQQRAVVEFVEKGGSFLNLHNSLGLYPDDGPYLELAGGRYTGHGPLERFRVEVVDREHPVTRGVEDFSVADEQHAPTYETQKVHLLLRSRSDEGQVAAAGWVREPGRGRLCHLAPGHTRESLLHPMYQRLLRNAIHWCLRRDGDAVTGAKTSN